MSILSREEAQALTQRILGLSHADECRVSLTSGLQANTRFADNGVTTSGDVTNDAVVIRSSPISSLRPRFFGWRADQREVTHWNCWTGIGESASFAKIVTKSYVIFI